jgi:hypothetical protein
LRKAFIYLFVILIGTRCAQITPLTGGKKDATPPKALSYYPENASLNFISKQITIQFDEYIRLKDIANQFIITPQTKEMPEIQANGKTLKITFNETLIPNATYKLSFGNAIIDLHEGNVLQNFEYIFSTGNTIDSLKLSGQILNAFDRKPAAKLLVGLYQANASDSVVYKDKPLYISKTDDAGNYSFNYLPNAFFKLVAINDVNKNLLYDGSEEQIAYSDTLINPNDGISPNLLLFKEVPFKSFIRRNSFIEYGKVIIAYNKPQKDIKSVFAKNLISYTKNVTLDTLTLYYDNQFDTLRPIVSYQTKKADTITIKIPSAETIVKLRKSNAITYSLRSNISSILPYYALPQFELNFPIEQKNIFENKITLVEQKDSVKTKKTITILNNRSSVNTFTIQLEFKPETNYTLTINKNALNDSIHGRFNDSISYKFTTTSPDDYAQLNLKLFFPKKENYIVLLLNDKEQLIKKTLVEFSLASTSEKLMEYKNVLPGNYFVRVVEDVNKNGLFDTGDYFLHKQPEPVFINTTAIKLLAGWEIENEWKVK